MKNEKSPLTKNIIQGASFLSALVILFMGLFHLVDFVRAASGELEVYTEASKVSDPAWKRTVTIGELTDEVKFKISVKNAGSETVNNVAVRFEPAVGFNLTEDKVTVIKNSGESHHNPSLLISDSGLNVGNLGPWSETADYAEVIFKVKLAYCPWSDLYRSGIKVDSDQTDEVTDQVDIKIDARCEDISIEKLVSNTERPDWKEEVAANLGEYVQYKVKISNPNPLPVTEVRVKDTLPQGLVLKKDSIFMQFEDDTMTPNPDNGDIFDDGYLLSLNLGAFGSEDHPYWDIVYKAKVEDCTSGRTKVNKAEVWTKWGATGTASATVVVAPCREELKIEKFVRWTDTDEWYEDIDEDEHLFDPGEEVEYKIVVKNSGDATAESVRVVDELPEYVKWISGDGNWDGDEWKVRFDLGNVNAGEEKTLRYTAKVLDEEDLPPTDRELKNVATLYEGEERIDDDHAQIWINGPEILAAAAEKPEKLPEAGADTVGLILISVGMVISGWGMKKIVVAL